MLNIQIGAIKYYYCLESVKYKERVHLIQHRLSPGNSFIFAVQYIASDTWLNTCSTSVYVQCDYNSELKLVSLIMQKVKEGHIGAINVHSAGKA